MEDLEPEDDFVFYKKPKKKRDTQEDTSDSDDDVSSIDEDLELTNQVLSMSIKAYESRDFDKKESKLGDAYLYLGHAHLESERPADAAECFKKGLDVKSTYLEEGHSELSELLYMCGVAFQALAKYEISLDYIKKAKANMLKTMEQVSSKYKSLNENDEAFTSLKKKMSCIEEELAEVDSKVSFKCNEETSLLSIKHAYHVLNMLITY